MGNHFEPTQDILDRWNWWVAERPPNVRAVAQKFNPWTLYLLTTTNHKVTIAVFDEEEDDRVTLRVNVVSEFNANLLHERRVFGIKPEDLVECDVPSLEERADNIRKGSTLSDERVNELIDDLKVLIRPDLWILNDEGIAIRK